MTATPSTEHTPEPWRLFGSACIEDARGATIARCRQGDAFDPITASEMLANARRIVACVNVLAGLPTEDIERIPPDSLHIGYNKIKKERDTLLSRIQSLEAALKAIIDCYGVGYGTDEYLKFIKDLEPFVLEARAALGHQEGV